MTADEWIKWTPEMNIPHPRELVEIKCKDGHHEQGMTKEFYWEHHYSSNDIISYRIIKEPRK